MAAYAAHLGSLPSRGGQSDQSNYGRFLSFLSTAFLSCRHCFDLRYVNAQIGNLIGHVVQLAADFIIPVVNPVSEKEVEANHSYEAEGENRSDRLPGPTDALL